MESINIKEFFNLKSNELKEEFERIFKMSDNIPKKVVFIRVGDDPASISYMRSKSKQLSNTGLIVEDTVFENKGRDENIKNILRTIDEINKDDEIIGVLVQSPVPEISKSDYQDIVNRINPEKDLDAFGELSTAAQLETPVVRDLIDTLRWPCTPLGILYYLNQNGYKLSGKKVAIVGRSEIVGRPLAIAMINSGAIVTVYNANMPINDINRELRTHEYNIIIGAVGKPEIIEIYRDVNNPNAIDKLDYVFDVGINRVEDSNLEKGYKLVGDIKFSNPESLIDTKFKYTTVPGGVGLLTRLGLLLRARRLLSLVVNID